MTRRPLERVRVAQEEVERPRQSGGRGLVAGEQQRHQLVADLGVGDRLAVLEPRRDEHREDVLARIRAALGDLAIQHPVDLPPALVEAPERVGRTPKRCWSSTPTAVRRTRCP